MVGADACGVRTDGGAVVSALLPTVQDLLHLGEWLGYVSAVLLFCWSVWVLVDSAITSAQAKVTRKAQATVVSFPSRRAS